MTTARCPACGASVLDGAPWCTLCYTDLRAPAAAPASAAEVVPAQPPAVEPPAQASPQAALASPLTASLDLLDPLLDAPVATAAQAVRGPVSWPCLACGASAALEHDTCPQCGTPFLAGADPVAAVDIPLLGPVRPLAVSKSSRVWLMIGGALAVCVVLTVVLSLVGLLL